ncbi:hypothetical protein C7H19_08915 [Aphanothece hegewaldii CCALA 016]|uniref:Uncharacterized protein n=1 Tax=Aphanothece hegewaldii CCALA 016 TaxID=2107694 RepID=A0A2T1LZ30_9CHRO|nr:hypothetical protein [Aphanothece hegewaldii]PSF37665.1 hypothetical protein C7H19_08915 [Aphanothece hegewaldii CCALA 016]
MDRKPHWQLYKELECLPQSIPEPTAEAAVLTFPLREAWKVLMNVLAQELVYEQQIEFLERCLDHELEENQPNNFWGKFLKLID